MRRLPCARRTKLLVILGAGSSLPCGVPGVEDINTQMKIWSREWKHLPTFPNGTGRGVFNDLWNILEQYYNRNPRPHLGISLNFEKVLGEMTALASWVSPSPFGNALSEAVKDSTTSDQFTWPSAAPDGAYFFRQLILEQTSYLLDRLAKYMRHHSRTVTSDDKNFVRFRQILDTLASEFDLGVYNLNYDDLAVRAMPRFFTGFTDGNFDGKGVAMRGEWNFVYHIHGSVHYSLSDLFGRGMTWRSDLSGGFNDSDHAFPYMASGFKPILPTTLIAGGFKLDQLLADPSQSFYASLIRHAHEADAILIGGYGFGDHHVNRALQNRCDLAPYNPSSRPPVVILTKTNPSIGWTANRPDLWAWELTHALNTRFGNDVQTPSFQQLVEHNHFEIDMHNRVAIWHGGFVEAATRLDAIINWLHT
jgi:hypothetical protein